MNETDFHQGAHQHFVGECEPDCWDENGDLIITEPETCGCEVRLTGLGEEIRYCATHEAAPVMLDALREALLALNDGPDGMGELRCHTCSISSDRGNLDDGVHDLDSACGKVAEAIRAAEGGA